MSAVHREIVLAAEPHAVYRAWLTPDILRQWLAPGPLECSRAEVEERVGGRFRIWHTAGGHTAGGQDAGGQDAGGFEAEILELVPDERIVWRWGFTGPEREQGPTFDSLLTVSLAAENGGTRLTLRHERLDALRAAMPHVAEQVGAGWDDVLQRLTVVVKQQ